jgi:ribonuclease HI
MLNTYNKVDGFTEKECVQQADRREWLLIAAEKQKLSMRPGAPFHVRWVHSHAGNKLEVAADKHAKQGAQMAYLPREISPLRET